MTENVFKAPQAQSRKLPLKDDIDTSWSSRGPKRRRTKDDFMNFCHIVLEYTKYESMRHDDLRDDLRTRHNSSPLGSSGSNADSFSSDSMSSSISSNDERILGPRGRHDDDDYDLITCFCMKPFARRPMIECSECLTWIHLSCAKIRKNNIPEEYICQMCRENRSITRKSNRMRQENTRLLQT